MKSSIFGQVIASCAIMTLPFACDTPDTSDNPSSIHLIPEPLEMNYPRGYYTLPDKFQVVVSEEFDLESRFRGQEKSVFKIAGRNCKLLKKPQKKYHGGIYIQKDKNTENPEGYSLQVNKDGIIIKLYKKAAFSSPGRPQKVHWCDGFL